MGDGGVGLTARHQESGHGARAPRVAVGLGEKIAQEASLTLGRAAISAKGGAGGFSVGATA
jgi:hypothetical protein